MQRSPRPFPWGLLALAFVAVPLIEIYVIVQVGQVIGAWWTIALLLAAGIIGSWLMKREGGRAWRALQEALSRGRMPARELADGILILIAGTLMLTPGFLSDVVGLFLILPLTRPLARAMLTGFVTRKLIGPGGPATGGAAWGTRPGAPDRGRTAQRPGDDDVIPGEVID